MAVLAEAIEGVADDPEAVRELDRAHGPRSDRLVAGAADHRRCHGCRAARVRSTRRRSTSTRSSTAIDSHATEAAARTSPWSSRASTARRCGAAHEQILLALNNLVSNAVRYSDSGGRVVVTASSTPDDMVDIVVTDTGIGIPPDDLERVFERFYRVDPARHRSTGGTGLGLSIVKHVAASHGGEVTAWSVEGEGSSLTLRLATGRDSCPPR